MPPVTTPAQTANPTKAAVEKQTSQESAPIKVPPVTAKMLEACEPTLSDMKHATQADKDRTLGILRKILGAPASATVDLLLRRDTGSAVLTSEDGKERSVQGTLTTKGAESGIPFTIRLNGNPHLEFEMGNAPTFKLRSGELPAESMSALLESLSKLDRRDQSLAYIAAGANGASIATIFSQESQSLSSAILTRGKTTEPLRVIGTQGSEYDRDGQLFLAVSADGKTFSAFRVRMVEQSYKFEMIKTGAPVKGPDGEITFSAEGAGQVRIPGTAAALSGQKPTLNGTALEQ